MNPQDEAPVQDKLSLQEKLYREQMGEEALARQQQLANEMYSCCGNRKELGHHPLCKTIGRARA